MWISSFGYCSMPKEHSVVVFRWPHAKPESAKGLGDEPAVSFAHGFFCDGVQAPLGKRGNGSQSGIEIPVGEVAEIDRGQRLILMCEVLHGVDAEGPQKLKPCIGDIGERVSEHGVLPVDDRHKLAILP